MHFVKSNSTLEWELSNFDPFVRCFDFKLKHVDDPSLAAWYNFNVYCDL